MLHHENNHRNAREPSRDGNGAVSLLQVSGLINQPKLWENVGVQIAAIQNYFEPQYVGIQRGKPLSAASIHKLINTLSLYWGFIHAVLGVGQPKLEDFANVESVYSWYLYEYTKWNSANSLRCHLNMVAHIKRYLAACATNDAELVASIHADRDFIKELASTAMRRERLEKRQGFTGDVLVVERFAIEHFEKFRGVKISPSLPPRDPMLAELCAKVKMAYWTKAQSIQSGSFPFIFLVPGEGALLYFVLLRI